MIPENAGYYHAAYIVAVVVYGAYALSIWWRRRAVELRGSGFRGQGSGTAGSRDQGSERAPRGEIPPPR